MWKCRDSHLWMNLWKTREIAVFCPTYFAVQNAVDPPGPPAVPRGTSAAVNQAE